ncbi:MAG: M23 family metallopeptidase [Granulosicoccus sp.]|nr:M23 family metallopeptidase [Granulosicoccus sp.]
MKITHQCSERALTAVFKPPASHRHWIRLSLLMMLAGCASVAEHEAGGVPSRAGASAESALGNVVASPYLAESLPLQLMICKTQVSNPPANERRRVLRRSALGCLNGVSVLVAPAPGACLTSGYGPRPRLHKGVDYQSRPASAVVAAAAGTVVEFGFRQQDFGHWIVIDHGSGVYTGYAHLDRTEPGLAKGVRVTRGQPLGIMGKTGNSTSSVHLHYEIRRGNLATARSWFRLDPVDPFALPGRCEVDA